MSFSLSMNTPHSVLIIGVTGGTGLACLRQLAQHCSQPSIHAFCRDPRRLSNPDQDRCTSVILGDARNVADIELALDMTGAEVVVLTTGTGESVAKSDIRTASAQALAQVMKKPRYHNIKAIVLSSIGAGVSKMNVGGGIGLMLNVYLRHVLKDHTGQEAAFESLKERTTIIRPTHLTDKPPTGHFVTFGDKDKIPSFDISRGDVAAWIVEEACGDFDLVGGRVVNLAASKQ